MKKRILSVILAIAMLACMIPMGMVTVSADATKKPVDTTLYWGFDDSTKTLYLSKTEAAVTGKGVTANDFDSTINYLSCSPNTAPWAGFAFAQSETVETVEILNDIAPGNTAAWFYYMSKLKEIKGIEHLYTGNVTSMIAMFTNCAALESLDVSSFDTSNVTDMSEMFANCDALKSLDLSSFDTSKVATMEGMFSGCRAFKSLDLSNFDTSKVTDMSKMFRNCLALKSLDLRSFNTSNVETMKEMFYCYDGYDSALESLDLSSFDTSKVTTMEGMFHACNSLKSLDLSSFDTSKVEIMAEMFSGCSSLVSLDLSSFVTTSLTTTVEMFYNCSSLVSLDLSSFVTTSLTTTREMFYNCSSLVSVDLSSFDTSNVSNIRSMFSGCSSLKTLDLSGFDLPQITTPVGAINLLKDSGIILIKTPKNLAKDVALPTLTAPMKWRYADTLTEYESANLPTNSANSITLVAGVPVDGWDALQNAINEAPGDATTPATATSSFILSKDLTAPDEASSITIPAYKDITLDLNGKVLNANGKCGVINVEEGGKFSVIDSSPETEHYFTVGDDGLWTLTGTKTETTKTVKGGCITGGKAVNGGAAFVCGTFTMFGGNIAGNATTSNDGGGVFINSDAAFTMKTGSIVGNTASSYGGGVRNNGTFTMDNGSIVGNTASVFGGGVFNIGTFTMKAGNIAGNTASYGGGIHMENGGIVYLTADAGKTISITGNTAGDAEGGIDNWGTLHLSGKIIIKDNICENTYGGSQNHPVNLATSATISIDGALTGSDIHVTHANMNNDEHDTGVLTSGYATYNDKVFTYDGPYAMIVNEDSELEVIIPPAAPHTHKDSTGKDVEFTPIADLTALKNLFATGGSGYLANDIVADGDLTVNANVNLCLNDKVLNLNEHHIIVNSGKNFALYDDAVTTRYYDKDSSTGLWTLKASGTSDYFTTGGVITGGKAVNGGGIYNAGTVNMFGGNIAGNATTSNDGGGVFINSDAAFTMKTGSIVGNTASSYGGGVRNNGTFTMDNGSIVGNTASVFGGGVFNIGTFTMKAGNIAGNTASYGGGIHMENGGIVYLTADAGKTISITDNTAGEAEGGIDNWGTLHLSGKIIIKDNICENTYGGSQNHPVNLATSATISIDGALTGSDIHVTHANMNNDEHDTGVLTSGYATYNDKVFTYDGPYHIYANADGELEVILSHVHHASTEYMTDGRAHWLKCDGEDCPLIGKDDAETVLNYEIAFSSYEGDALKELLDYSETCHTNGADTTSMLMGRQGKYDKHSKAVSNTDGRTIIGLTQDQLDNIGNELIIVGSDDSDSNKQVSVNVDCAYTWFYDVDAQTGEAVKVEAEQTTDLNGNPIAAFVIIDSELAGTITGFGYYRVYSDTVSDSNLIGEALYKAPRTFKAVYDEKGNNELNFYFDTKTHDGTVYENTEATPNGLVNVESKWNGLSVTVTWGYESIRGSVKGVAIDPTVIKYKGLEYTIDMFANMISAESIEGAEYLDVTNVKRMDGMFSSFAADKATYEETGTVTDFDQVPDVSRWNTANVTNMGEMFYCFGATSEALNTVPDVSRWNTGSVASMKRMFNTFGKASTVLDKVPDVSEWDTANVTTVGEMFETYGYSSETFNAVPDVSEWDTANVTDVSHMFAAYAYSSTVIDFTPDLSKWNVGKVNFSTDKDFVFIDCCMTTTGNWNVIIPAKTGDQPNDSEHWYVGDGTKVITPASGREFTLAN